MKFGTFIFILSSVLLSPDATTCSAGAPPEEHLAGKWSCESATVNGKVLAAEKTKLFQLTMTKDRYKTDKDGEVLFDSSYTLDTAKTPKQINIVGTEGDLKGKEAQGIYSLEGDTLKICYTMPGGKRPTAFESAAGSEAYLMVWKRKKS